MMIRYFSDHIQKDLSGSIHRPVKNVDMSDWPNRIIYHKVSRAAYLNHIGSLSIKYVFNGQESYHFDRNRLVVEEGSYLILNNQRCYCNFIDSESEVESLNIFFNRQIVEEVLAGLITPDDKLLDDYDLTFDQPVLFFEKLYSHDKILTPLLKEIKDLIKSGLGSQIAFDECLHNLLERMLLVHRMVYKEIEKLPAVRSSTRVELFRRLHRAKDFIDSSFKENIGLDEMAETANLSRYHFLRLFKKAFNETPHQYLIGKRLESAKRLLAETDLSITQICFEVGFESLSSINRLFRQRFGRPPKEFKSRETKRNVWH